MSTSSPQPEGSALPVKAPSTPVKLTHALKMKLSTQRDLAMRLSEWHDGQPSALYAVSSCMLGDCQRGVIYDPRQHAGHMVDETKDDCGLLSRAISELRRTRDDGHKRASVKRSLDSLVKKLKAIQQRATCEALHQGNVAEIDRISAAGVMESLAPAGWDKIEGGGEVTIATHYDTGGIIRRDSNPADEFRLWQAHAAANPSDWSGGEFTLADFETYIAGLRSPAADVVSPRVAALEAGGPTLAEVADALRPLLPASVTIAHEHTCLQLEAKGISLMFGDVNGDWGADIMVDSLMKQNIGGGNPNAMLMLDSTQDADAATVAQRLMVVLNALAGFSNGGVK